MKYKITFALSLLAASYSFAQPTVGMDFDTTDCNGNNQHLFADLDQGNVVIIEYFMLSCGSCIVAGNKLEAMKTDLEVQFPGKVKAYAIGFSDSYSCASITDWVTSNGYNSIPMAKGAKQVAYYGGMGMPTVVVLGGTDHAILGSPYIGLQTSDTSLIANSIRTFFGEPSLGLQESEEFNAKVRLFPNPTNSQIEVSLIEAQSVSMEILDLNGRLIQSLGNFENFTSKSFDLSGLNQGSYFLNIQSQKGNTRKKFTVIQ